MLQGDCWNGVTPIGQRDLTEVSIFRGRSTSRSRQGVKIHRNCMKHSDIIQSCCHDFEKACCERCLVVMRCGLTLTSYVPVYCSFRIFIPKNAIFICGHHSLLSLSTCNAVEEAIMCFSVVKPKRSLRTKSLTEVMQRLLNI